MRPCVTRGAQARTLPPWREGGRRGRPAQASPRWIRGGGALAVCLLVCHGWGHSPCACACAQLAGTCPVPCPDAAACAHGTAEPTGAESHVPGARASQPAQGPPRGRASGHPPPASARAASNSRCPSPAVGPHGRQRGWLCAWPWAWVQAGFVRPGFGPGAWHGRARKYVLIHGGGCASTVQLAAIDDERQ